MSTLKFWMLITLLSTLSEASTIYSFHSFEVCSGCSTQTGGINDAGIVGANSPSQGYFYDVRTGVSSLVPGALAVTVPSNDGRIPGLTAGPGGTLVPFIREANGTINSYPGYRGAP